MALITRIPQSEIENYMIGKEETIWGIKDDKKTLDLFKKENKLLFIAGINYQGEGKAPKGFPILKSYDNIELGVEEMWRCTVTSKPKRIKSSFGEKYPYIFEIEFVGDVPDFPLTKLKPELIEIVRKLYIGRKRFVKIDDKFFESPFV